jgi:uncharacterized protein YjiS (DUF1127 family)
MTTHDPNILEASDAHRASLGEIAVACGRVIKIVGNGLAAGLDRLNEWLNRARQRRMLAGLDDRALADMKISRCDAWMEASKPFWRK